MSINVRNSFMGIGILFVIAFTIAVIGSMLSASIAGAASSGFASESTTLYAWGNNANGQLGQGDYGAGTNRDTPTRVGDADNWVQVATAAGGAAVLNAGGHIYQWGALWTAPQMGQGDNPANPGMGLITVPTRVGDRDDWAHVEFSGASVAGISDSGHLYTWGDSSQGQLGHGDYDARDVPTRLGTRSDWASVAIAGSGNFMIGITDAGHMYAWGNNAAQGRLGLGHTGGTYNTPQRVGTATNWVSASTAGQFSTAINTDGELFAWGGNIFGQLGLGDMGAGTHRTVPTQVGTATNWVDTASGIDSTVALNADGEIWSWGVPELGRLGRSVTAANPQYLPGRVGDADNWVALGSGNTHFLALNEAFELYTWGLNSSGQLGIGTIGGYEATPQFVLQAYSFAGFSQTGAGNHSMALIRTEPIELDLTLTKDLQKPTGTPVPNITFSFTFTPHSFNDNTTNLTPLPTIPTRTVTINSSNTSTPNSPSTGITTTSNSVDILEGVTFTQPGVYAWTVAEVQSATGIGNLSTVHFSQETYRLRAYVTQAAVGSPLAIHSTTVHRLTDRTGTVINPPVKVPALSFTNIYIRTTIGDNDYPGALTLSKTVTGQFAVLTTPFDFHVTLTRTALCPPTTNFVGRIMQGNTQIGADIAFASGVQQTVTLTHGQRLVFDELVVGTHFTSTELPALEFRASVVLFVNGQAVTVAPNTLPNLALPIGSHLIGVERNTADFTNAHAYLPPTGLGIGNYTTLLLPAVALLIVSLLAFRARRRIEELSYL